jgi:hypothetical protein
MSTVWWHRKAFEATDTDDFWLSSTATPADALGTSWRAHVPSRSVG